MNRQWLEPGQQTPPVENPDVEVTISLREVFSVIRRRVGIIISTIVLCALVAAGYVFTAKPVYEGSAVILIDPSQPRIMADNTQDAFMLKDNLVVESEIEVIKSSELLKRVVKAENIYEDQEFTTPSLVSQAKKWVYDQLQIVEETSSGDGKRAIFNGFRDRVSAKRIGLTYAIRVGYASTDPERAAKITNAIAKTYLDDKLESRYASIRRTNDWLRGRISKLQREVIAADRAVELYKSENNIVDVSTGLISDQQLSELNSQLIIARSKTAQAKARFDRIKLIIKEKNADAALEDVLSSREISNLRTKYAAAQSRARELKSKYGPTHLAYINFKAQVERIQALILEELKRIQQSYESAYAISRAREKSLEKELQKVKQVHVFTGQKEVKLRELKRQADAGRDLYKSLLETFRKSNERETLPTVNARIIEFAAPPEIPSKPKKRLVLMLALVIGFAAGTGLAFLRESLDSLIWTPEALENLFAGTNLGLIPELKIRMPRLKSWRKHGRAKVIDNADGEDETGPLALEPKLVAPFQAPLADQFSHVSEVLRNILVTFRLMDRNATRKGAKVITFISTMPGEGKSTVSMLQALYQSGHGQRTLLIDSDFRKPFLTRSLTPESEYGICDLALDENPDLKRYIWHDEKSGLDFLPALSAGGSIGTADFFIRGDISGIIDKLRADYDYIIIDLPPILVLPDARVLADTIDHIVYVVEWGKVHRESVVEAMKSSPELSGLIIGSVLNKVNIKKIKRYGGYYYGSQYYYS